MIKTRRTSNLSKCTTVDQKVSVYTVPKKTKIISPDKREKKAMYTHLGNLIHSRQKGLLKRGLSA